MQGQKKLAVFVIQFRKQLKKLFLFQLLFNIWVYSGKYGWLKIKDRQNQILYEIKLFYAVLNEADITAKSSTFFLA